MTAETTLAGNLKSLEEEIGTANDVIHFFISDVIKNKPAIAEFIDIINVPDLKTEPTYYEERVNHFLHFLSPTLSLSYRTPKEQIQKLMREEENKIQKQQDVFSVPSPYQGINITFNYKSDNSRTALITVEYKPSEDD